MLLKHWLLKKFEYSGTASIIYYSELSSFYLWSLLELISNNTHVGGGQASAFADDRRRVEWLIVVRGVVVFPACLSIINQQSLVAVETSCSADRLPLLAALCSCLQPPATDTHWGNLVFNRYCQFWLALYSLLFSFLLFAVGAGAPFSFTLIWRVNLELNHVLAASFHILSDAPPHFGAKGLVGWPFDGTKFCLGAVDCRGAKLVIESIVNT